MKGAKLIFSIGGAVLVFVAIVAGIVYATRSENEPEAYQLSQSRKVVLEVLDRMPIIDGYVSKNSFHKKKVACNSQKFLVGTTISHGTFEISFSTTWTRWILDQT